MIRSLLKLVLVVIVLVGVGAFLRWQMDHQCEGRAGLTGGRLGAGRYEQSP